MTSLNAKGSAIGRICVSALSAIIYFGGATTAAATDLRCGGNQYQEVWSGSKPFEFCLGGDSTAFREGGMITLWADSPAMNRKGDGPWRLRFQPGDEWLVSEPVSGIPHSSGKSTYTSRYFISHQYDVLVARSRDLGAEYHWRITSRRAE